MENQPKPDSKIKKQLGPAPFFPSFYKKPESVHFMLFDIIAIFVEFIDKIPLSSVCAVIITAAPIQYVSIWERGYPNNGNYL